ncbi:MAG: 30S ribosomal protein S9 [Planctomycetota bacterium]|jgi:small subunit ribosomal protein S9
MTEAKIENPDINIAGDIELEITESEKKPAAKPVKKKTNADKGGYWWGTGRRKSSVARVRIKPGSGKMLINKKELNDYFSGDKDRKAVLSPLKAVDAERSFDIFVNVNGGGTTGQAEATLLGIARALKNFNEAYLQPLRDGRYLTRDSREVERKKPGQRGARRRFQFSKR